MSRDDEAYKIFHSHKMIFLTRLPWREETWKKLRLKGEWMLLLSKVAGMSVKRWRVEQLVGLKGTRLGGLNFTEEMH